MTFLTSLLCLFGNSLAAQNSMAKGFGSFGLQKGTAQHAVQRAQFPDGTKVERFELRAGDCSKRHKDCSRDRERVEFYEKGKMQSLGKEVWVGWSVYVPKDFPIQGRKMNVKLGQFHQLGGSGPELLFELNDSNFVVKLQNPNVRDDDPMRPKGDFKRATLASRSAVLGRWTRVVVNANWSRSADGFVTIWVNGKKKFSYAGPTTNDTGKIYFRYGLYRSFVSRCGGPCPTLISYYKNVVRGNSEQSVQ